MSASNPPRQSRKHGASRTPPPTGGCVTMLAGCDARGALPHTYQWCAGCAREISFVGRWTRGWRAVGDVGKIGQAKRMRLTYPGCHATTVHRGRCTLRVAAKPSLRHETQQLRKAIPKRPAHLTAPLKPASRNHRRGRRPRRPFRWMTDNVGLLLNATTRVVGRTVPGAPPSAYG